MKFIKLIGHPVLVISLFLLLLISGESFGGFYATYILMGLPAGVPDTIFAVLGIGLMVIGYNVHLKKYAFLKPVLYVAGIVLMIISLILFFKITKGYNNQTFHQLVPLISFALYGISVLCNIVHSIRLLLIKEQPRRSRRLNIVS